MSIEAFVEAIDYNDYDDVASLNFLDLSPLCVTTNNTIPITASSCLSTSSPSQEVEEPDVLSGSTNIGIIHIIGHINCFSVCTHDFF